MILDEKKFFRSLPLIETPQLVLRRVAADDAHDLFRYANDPEVSRFVLWEAHRNLSDSVNFIRGMLEKYDSGQVSEWCVQEKASGRMVGTCGFVALDAEHSRAEIGYAFARRVWGRGFATEAVRAVLKMGFGNLRINRIEARTMLANVASQRVLEKVGLRLEGVLRQQVRRAGTYYDVRLYAQLREDYLRQQQTQAAVATG